ncbi:uncharacterized protein TNCV_2677971 [Trichonephila clavipes]|nr:uncharacterized protein TNCV_2677971 [Trichonephila clavipes]
MLIYTLQDALSICYKQSSDTSRSVAFFQRANSSCLIEDKTFNDSDIINNLIDYEDGQKELDSLRADKIYAGIQLSSKLEKHILKIDTNSERRMEFQKELQSCISGYTDIYKQLTNQPSSRKLIFYFMVPKTNQ